MATKQVPKGGSAEQKKPAVAPQAAKAKVPPVTPQVAKAKVPPVTPQAAKAKVPPVTPQAAKAKVPPVTPQAAKAKVPAKAVAKDDKANAKPGGKDPPKDTSKKPVKEEKKESGQGGGGRSGRQEEHPRGRDRGRRDKEEREMCRNFLHNRCDRGSLCRYYHPRSSSRSRYGLDDPEQQRHGSPTSSGGGPVVCRDYARNMCTRGQECRFYHPPEETSDKKPGSSGFTFCHDFRNGLCLRNDCRFFHITREDEESYRITGEIPLHTIDQAVRKAMVLDGALTGTRPTCKEFLRGLCNMQNCRFRHLSQREYEDEIFHALQEEFESLLGPPEHRPTSPPIGAHPYASLATFHDAAQKYAAQADFREDVLPPDDMRGALMPLSEYESEPKRPRYFSGDAVFPGEDYRNGGDVPRKWDERMPYDHMERPELNAGDVYRLQEELYAIRNENAEMRRGAERDITELKEEVRRVLEENANLHHEVAKVRAVATDESLLQKATIDKLTLTNNTLMEDLRKAQDTARHIEHDCLEKLKVMDGKQKNNSMQLEHKIQEVQKEASMLRDALNKANNIQKKTEDEKVRLRGELDDMRAKMRNQSAASSLRKDSQQHGTGSYGNKNAYPRDSGRQAQMPEHSGATFPDMRHGDRRPPDIRDQEVRGSEMYSPEEVWGGDNSTRPPYDNSYGVRGGALEGDRSRWHGAPTSQDAWGSHGGAKGTGSLMGEYQGGDDRSRGPPQNTPLIRGPSYPSPAGSGLLNLPIDVVDYGKSSTRPPQDSSQGGIESQYGQERRRFEDRSYSLSGYDTDARGSQFGHQHSSTGWQQGGDGGRGRPIDQGWRREKPF